MGKKMRKNSFAEGTIIAYLAIVITKLLGALYNIPFYGIIGDRGGVIYSYAYTIYALFLDISTSGIPIAISIVISEYATRGMYRSKERAYSLGLRLVVLISVVAFAVLQLLAEPIGRFFIGDMTQGVLVDDVAVAIRTISICLLIVPFLSMRRGYLQGHKCLSATSASQVIEQIVRIAVVLVGVYVTIIVLDLGTTTGVCVALLGAAVGALAALLYLRRKKKDNAELFFEGADCEEENPASNKEILRKIFFYCITIIIVSMATNVYNIVDMKMLLVGLHNLNYSDEATQVIASIASSWIPKICMIVAALSIGMTSSIAPHMAESYTAGDLCGVNNKLNQALGILLVVSLPLATGMAMFAEPVYRVFYGDSLYGGNILVLALAVNVAGSMTNVVGMAMQSIDRGKTVCIYTVVGIALNTALDLPFIYGFNAIGLPAYLGASAASIVGQAVTVLLLLGSLRRNLQFSYSPAWRTFWRVLIPTTVMAAVVWLLKWLWPVVETRGLLLIVQLAAFGVAGALVYALLAYKNGALFEIISEEKVRGILGKFRLGKGKTG